MGITSAIKGLFSAPKVIDNIFDKDKGLLTQVGEWVGNSKLTDEERMENDKAVSQAIHGYAIATMAENTDRSKARRKIAIEWIALQVWLIKINVLTIFVDYLANDLLSKDPGFTGAVAKIAFSPYVWGITGAVSVFFFGSHALRGWQEGKK